MGKKKKDVVEAETPAAVASETKTETLLWNERGQIGCTLPGHAPHKGSDTWKFEHWKKIPEGATKEDGEAFRCETCAQAERAPAEQTPEPQAVEPETDAPKKKGRKSKGDMTLADLAEKYLAHMEESGKSSGTIFSYRLELATATNALGAETKVADLTPEKVMLFFGSARVNKKRNGKPKSPLSIAKTQRVLRLALVWAVEKKLIEKAPLPEDAATH